MGTKNLQNSLSGIPGGDITIRQQSTSEATFAELMGKARQHDEEAVVTLYRRAMPVIYRYVLAHLGQPDLAEDVVSDVFLVIMAHTQRGIILQQTSTTLKVVVNADDLPTDSVSIIGVLNPDGTAAQMKLPEDPDRLPHAGNPLRNKPGTPEFIDKSNFTHYQAHNHLSSSVPWKWK